MIKRYAIAQVPSRGMYLSTFNNHFVYPNACDRFVFKSSASRCLDKWRWYMYDCTGDYSFLAHGRYQIVDLSLTGR